LPSYVALDALTAFGVSLIVTMGLRQSPAPAYISDFEGNGREIT
jgi:hypothetical protein